LARKLARECPQENYNIILLKQSTKEGESVSIVKRREERDT